MIWIFVASNIAIAAAYIVLGFYVSPRFDIVGVPTQVAIAKYAMLGFFLFCAITHIEQAVHVLTETRANVEWMLSWHMIANHVLQSICAPVAAFFAMRFLRISIVPSNPIKETPKVPHA